MKNSSYHRFFLNFSSESKSRIIELLREGPMSVKEIVSKTGWEQSKVSHNLSSLRCCCILNVRREGRRRIYSLNEESVIPVLRLVEKHVKNVCLERCDE